MEKFPLLTICVPVYNGEKFIEKALRTILAQDYPNFEILVSDNGSTDNTIQIVKSLNSPKISIRYNDRRDKTDKHYLRCYDNYNGCLASGLIKSDFVAFYHSDDLLNPAIARKEMEFLLQNPDVGAVFTMGDVIDEKDDFIKNSVLPRDIKEKRGYYFRELFETVLKHGNFLLTPTMMARTSVFSNVGPFNEKDFESSADLEMFLRMSKQFPIAVLREELFSRRSGGMSKRYNSLRTDQANHFKVIDYFFGKETFNPKIDDLFLRQYEYQKKFDDTLRAMNFLLKNDVDGAKKMLPNPFTCLFSFIENPAWMRAKILALNFILFFGLNLGLGNALQRQLKKLTGN